MGGDVAVPTVSPRDEVLWRGQGFLRLLNVGHALEQDVYGAVDAEQWDMAALAARRLVLEICAIASISRGGSVLWSSQDAVTHDPLVHCSDGIRLLSDAVLVAAAEPRIDGGALTGAVRALVAALSDEFGMPADMPRLREPDGMFWAMSVGRGTLSASEELGLPSIIPASWLAEGSGGEA